MSGRLLTQRPLVPLHWFGTGLLCDGAGDDLYHSVYFSQASGAHFCIGAIIDEGGNDKHVLYETGGAGVAYGWDFAISLLIDKAGDDLYEVRMMGLGCAQIRARSQRSGTRSRTRGGGTACTGT